MTSPPPVFLDATYLIARADENDQWRAAAVRVRPLTVQRHLVTTDGVLGEFMAHVARSGPNMRLFAARSAERLKASPTVEVVEQTTALMAAGIDAYRGEFRYTRLSLQDCIAILVMRERGITEALTADQEFLRAGITPLRVV